MPFTPLSRTPSGPRRRSLLAGAAGTGAVLLAGCSASGSSSEAVGGSSSAAARARAAAARDSERLAQRYEAVLAAHPALSGRLSPLLAEVVRHAEAFGGGGRASDTASASASASASAAPSPEVPATRKEALAELAAAEREVTDRRTKALLDAPGELARLLASVAAAGAGHAFLLTEDEK
ncbi:hypothetical protein QF026_002590 [Streptomyces aurantiacus]|uniref:hypothetical protein n=1 Tax=Streptomyces aurantiacus TaxID=47760 RepID=UPI00279421AC|nr:hypothetical protein [Streptomyces aurantiacus]MDQ0774124.1 hypothetical protein [Streptomyces aurantiacus]